MIKIFDSNELKFHAAETAEKQEGRCGMKFFVHVVRCAGHALKSNGSGGKADAACFCLQSKQKHGPRSDNLCRVNNSFEKPYLCITNYPYSLSAVK